MNDAKNDTFQRRGRRWLPDRPRPFLVWRPEITPAEATHWLDLFKRAYPDFAKLREIVTRERERKAPDDSGQLS
jgi:hypothetical protein